MDPTRGANGSASPEDIRHWDAVEDATELLQEGRYEEALTALRDILRQQPNNPYAFNYVGVGLFELKQLEPARDAFRAAVRLAPDYIGARVALSNVMRLLGNPRGALAQAREVLRRFPKDADALHAAGLASAACGERGAATRDLQDFLAQAPEFEAATEVRQILASLGLGDEGEPLDVESLE